MEIVKFSVHSKQAQKSIMPSYARFRSSRVIGHGCPLSPYLFVLAVNELSLTQPESLQANHLSRICLGSNYPGIHSLMFAYYLLVCGKANVQEALAISNISDPFCHASGQVPSGINLPFDLAKMCLCR